MTTTLNELRRRLESQRRWRDALLRDLRDARLDPDADPDDTRRAALETLALDGEIRALEAVFDALPATVYWCPACAEEQREGCGPDETCMTCGAALASVTTDTLHALTDHRDAGREEVEAPPDGWPPGWDCDESPSIWEGDGATIDIFRDQLTVRGPVQIVTSDRLHLARALAWVIHHHTTTD
jgi:hypothetical protein